MNVRLMKHKTIRFFCLLFLLILVLLIGRSCSEGPPLEPFASYDRTQSSVYPFTFIVFGDSRPSRSLEGVVATKIDRTRPIIIKKIAELQPAFIINTGDMVVKGSSKSDWAGFDRENQVFSRQEMSQRRYPRDPVGTGQEQEIGYYPVLGNHEYKGRDKKARANYFARFPHINHQRWYAFQTKNCLLVVLDSNFDELDKEELQQQNQWLENTLTSAETNPEISFVFTFFHHPPYTNSKKHQPYQAVQQNFVPLFEKSSKLRFAFCGHVHNYERFRINGINYIVTGGGGAPLHKMLAPEEWRFQDEYGPDKPRATHFCIITVEKDKIRFKTLHLDPDKLTWQTGDTLLQHK